MIRHGSEVVLWGRPGRWVGEDLMTPDDAMRKVDEIGIA
jgi:hypothetical protein